MTWRASLLALVQALMAKVATMVQKKSSGPTGLTHAARRATGDDQ